MNPKLEKLRAEQEHVRRELEQTQHQQRRLENRMLYLMRKQMFLDGNKRTAMLAANAEMIASGCGIISIPIEQQRDFMDLLIRYYESNDMEEIKEFVYQTSIDGIEFEQVAVQEALDKTDGFEIRGFCNH